MKCKDVREQLMDAVAPGASPELRSHLRDCADCAGALAALERTVALLDEWKAPPPSPFFDTRLQARLDEARREQPMHASWFAWLRKPVYASLATGAAVIALTIGVGVYQQQAASQGGVNKAGITLSPPAKGTAVADLQSLDKDEDMFSDFEMLDDLGGQPHNTDSGSTF
jgi:anti-sigma factor RsiW